MEMILMGMRDEDGVDGTDVEVRGLAATPDRADAARQERIEQEPAVRHLEPYRRVAEPAQTRHGWVNGWRPCGRV